MFLIPTLIKIATKIISLHRSIIYLENNFELDDSIEITHRDGNPLNNLLSNLRKCTTIQNCQNQRKLNLNKPSKFKGVSFSKEIKNGKQKYMLIIKIYFLDFF